MLRNHTRWRLETRRRAATTPDAEADYHWLDQLVEQGGDEWVDEILGAVRLGDGREDGGTFRVLRHAGFTTVQFAE